MLDYFVVHEGDCHEHFLCERVGGVLYFWVQIITPLRKIANHPKLGLEHVETFLSRNVD